MAVSDPDHPHALNRHGVAIAQPGRSNSDCHRAAVEQALGGVLRLHASDGGAVVGAEDDDLGTLALRQVPEAFAGGPAQHDVLLHLAAERLGSAREQIARLLLLEPFLRDLGFLRMSHVGEGERCPGLGEDAAERECIAVVGGAVIRNDGLRSHVLLLSIALGQGFTGSAIGSSALGDIDHKRRLC